MVFRKRAVSDRSKRGAATGGGRRALRSLTGLSLALALAGTTSVAAMTTDQVDSDVAEALEILASEPSEPGQSVEAGGDVVLSAPVTDESYNSTSAQDLRRASAARRAAALATLVNSMTKADGPVRWPFVGPVRMTDGYGPRWGEIHEGQDFVPGEGAPVVATAAGVVVTSADSQTSSGVHITIRHEIDGKVVFSRYLHMQYGSRQVEVGDQVTAGQMIGAVGSTGRSTGPHLHFEIRLGSPTGESVDPLPWLHAHMS